MQRHRTAIQDCREGRRATVRAAKPTDGGLDIRSFARCDVSVSHADVCFPAPETAPGHSPLEAVLSAFAACEHVSLCTPGRPIEMAAAS